MTSNSVVAERALAPLEEIQRVFQLQRQNKWRIAKTDAKTRVKKLKAIKRAVERRTHEIAAALYADLGKPEAEALATEVYPLNNEIKHVCRRLAGWMRPQGVLAPLAFLGSSNEIRHQPKGVALIISPWNFPFQLAIGPLISAVAAGCCAMLKPSELSPQTSALVKSFVEDLFDESEIAVFEGDKDVAQALLEQPFDHVHFTGGTEIGKKVMAAAARQLTSVTLELGGKSPVIIDESANLQHAAKRVAWGKFINAGQTCVAPDYILAPAGRAEEFADLVAKAVVDSYGPSEKVAENPDYCRIVNQRHFQRVAGLLDDALKCGARVVAGGETREEDRFISPTLLLNIALESRIMKEEIFGPLLPILPYQDLDGALEIVNSLPHPLALYIFGARRDVMERILEETRAGDTLINDVVVHFSNAALPFGGVGHSGIGKSHGFHGFQAFSHQRSVMRQPRFSGISFLKPPYTSRVKKLIEWTIRYF